MDRLTPTAPAAGRPIVFADAVPAAFWRHFVLHIVSPAVLALALFLAFIFAVIVPVMKASLVERKKEMLRELVSTVCSELAVLHAQERAGVLAPEAARQAAKDRIRALRYGDQDKDYFWITDLEPRMIMHPYRPEMDGRPLGDYADPAGNKLFDESVRLVRERGEGYVEYLWQWMDDERRVVPKLSFVRGFEPWGWVVGTGIYLEDVRAEIRSLVDRILLAALVVAVLTALLLGHLARQGLMLERRRWQAEAALRASEEKYRLLVESAAEGILLLLADRPVYGNRTLLTMTGYAEDELARLSLAALLESPPGTAPDAPGRAVLTCKDGRRVEVVVSSTPVTMGERTGRMIHLRDPAAHNRTEGTLARILTELQSASQSPATPVREARLLSASCGLDTPVRQVAVTMSRAKASAVLVNGPAGRPVGIITDGDLRERVLAGGLDPDATPAGAVMSAPLVSVAGGAPLLEAALVMQERDFAHLVVGDGRGGVLGVLAAKEILKTQRHSVAMLLEEVRRAGSVEDLREVRARLPALVLALLEGGNRVEHVTRAMSAVSDAVVVRLIALTAAELGPSPARFAFLALGSEARGEQTLATDQDNAIVHEDLPEAGAAAARAWFLRLGELVCDRLDTVGYQRCKGQAMAGNPKWCLPLAAWRGRFDAWVGTGEPQDLADLGIFFDFRLVHGDEELVDRLRGHLRGLLGSGHPRFFFNMAQATLLYKPPLGFFGNLQTESTPARQEAFNIKAAVVPIVNFARIYALRHNLDATGTLDRLRRLLDLGILLPSAHDELVQAYAVLLQVRLKHQSRQAAAGQEPDNLVPADELTGLDRALIKKVLSGIVLFQARLQADFTRADG